MYLADDAKAAVDRDEPTLIAVIHKVNRSGRDACPRSSRPPSFGSGHRSFARCCADAMRGRTSRYRGLPWRTHGKSCQPVRASRASVRARNHGRLRLPRLDEARNRAWHRWRVCDARSLRTGFEPRRTYKQVHGFDTHKCNAGRNWKHGPCKHGHLETSSTRWSLAAPQHAAETSRRRSLVRYRKGHSIIVGVHLG
jgi:hypothetical protein